MVDRLVFFFAALLAFAFAACTHEDAGGTALRPTSWTGVSKRSGIVATVAPEQGPPQINKFQTWILQLRQSDGTPVYPARIGINGGMPDHGHGLPTRPEVTQYLGEGKYRVEGLKLNMMGQWVLLFEVTTPSGKDRIQVDLELAW
ncbi:MAG: FixH family protein [Myxococcota bacterium]